MIASRRRRSLKATDISDQPRSSTSVYEGRLQGVGNGHALGWCWKPAAPNETVQIAIAVDGEIVAEALADIARPELAGYGSGAHGFMISLPDSLQAPGRHRVLALAGHDRVPILTAQSFWHDAKSHSRWSDVVFEPGEPLPDGRFPAEVPAPPEPIERRAVIAAEWLFDAREFDRSFVEPTPTHLDVLANDLTDTATKCAALGLAYIPVVVPSKRQAIVLADPPHREWLESLNARLRDLDEIELLDLLPVLHHGARHGPMYHRSDIDWNDRGAFFVARALLKEARKRAPALRPLALTDLHLRPAPGYRGTLLDAPRLEIVEDMPVPSEQVVKEENGVVIDASKLRALRMPVAAYLVEAGSTHLRVYMTPDCAEDARVAIVGDSASLSVTLWLAERARRTTFFWAQGLPLSQLELELPPVVFHLIREADLLGGKPQLISPQAAGASDTAAPNALLSKAAVRASGTVPVAKPTPGEHAPRCDVPSDASQDTETRAPSGTPPNALPDGLPNGLPDALPNALPTLSGNGAGGDASPQDISPPPSAPPPSSGHTDAPSLSVPLRSSPPPSSPPPPEPVCEPLTVRRRALLLLAGATDPPTRRAWVQALDPRWPFAVLGAGLFGYGLLLMILSRHLGFFQDEYFWILHRGGWNVNAFLESHNGHFSLVPVTAYKLLFVIVGLGHTWPYRTLLVLLHIGCVVMLYTLAARRVGRAPALLPAGLLLMLGSGAEDLLWAFQIGLLGSLAAFLGALLCLDRNDKPGDRAAALLLFVALASDGIGVPLTVAVLVELVLTRSGRRRLWVAAVPLALYGLWYLGYGTSEILSANIRKVPSYDEAIASYGFAGLFGVTVSLGGALLAGALAWLAGHVVKGRNLSPRAIASLLAVLGFWTVVALTRAQYEQPEASRYIYASGLLILLALVMILPRLRLNATAGIVLTAIVAFAGFANLSPLVQFARDRTAVDTAVQTALGAAEIAGPAASPHFQPDAHHLPWLYEGQYLSAVHELGSPAFTPEKIMSLSGDDRELADDVLLNAESIPLLPPSAKTLLTAIPAPIHRSHGLIVDRTMVAPGAVCRRLTPSSQEGYAVVLVAPGHGLYITMRGAGQVAIYVRRLAPRQPPRPLHVLPSAGTPALLTFPHDAGKLPWRVRLAPTTRTAVCLAPS